MAEFASHQIDVANWAIDAEPVVVVGARGIDYWRDGQEASDNVHALFEYPGSKRLSVSALLLNGHFGFDDQILGDHGTLIISVGKGLYFREMVPTLSSDAAKEPLTPGRQRPVPSITRTAIDTGEKVLWPK